ncbi:MAG TPA: DUF4276 family protein [Pirellulales bacterium]|nr:DUF4276 family protein [Pirellulales bacterium]
MNIQPVVEGFGEISSLPVLVRRLRDIAEVHEIDVNRPIRRPRGRLVIEAFLREVVQLARRQEECGAILVVLDADDDCPAEMAPSLKAWASEEAGDIPCDIVMPKREFEAWFLAAIESLRGSRGIRDDAASHQDPEAPRDAKGKLEACMRQGASYYEKADQPALTAQFDMREAHHRCRSFRKLVKAFGDLTAAMGHPIEVWPPADWGEE